MKEVTFELCEGLNSELSELSIYGLSSFTVEDFKITNNINENILKTCSILIHEIMNKSENSSNHNLPLFKTVEEVTLKYRTKFLNIKI
jgi:hypothetical protein